MSNVDVDIASAPVPLCAEPTPQGEQLLDPFHICGRVKRIRDKPVQSFAGSDTFLRIAQAEKEGLIEVRIDVGSLRSYVLPLYDFTEILPASQPYRTCTGFLRA